MKRRSILTRQRISKLFVHLLIYVLLISLSFIILFPFISKIFGMFLSYEDSVDAMVKYLPKNPTLANIKYILFETEFFHAMFNTAIISLLYAFLATASASLVGYGLAKFRLKLTTLFIVLIVFTMLVPPQTVMLPIFSYFRYFDPFGIVTLITGSPIKLNDTLIPIVFLGISGFGFRAGLFALIIRQFFTGVPDQLTEAAYVDGSGVFKTFLRIMLPLARPVLITVFLFSFCWQWTDEFFSSLLYEDVLLLSNYIIDMSYTLGAGLVQMSYISSVYVNTAVLFAIIPVVMIFCIFQRGFVQGIERSGLVE